MPFTEHLLSISHPCRITQHESCESLDTNLIFKSSSCSAVLVLISESEQVLNFTFSLTSTSVLVSLSCRPYITRRVECSGLVLRCHDELIFFSAARISSSRSQRQAGVCQMLIAALPDFYSFPQLVCQQHFMWRQKSCLKVQKKIRLAAICRISDLAITACSIVVEGCSLIPGTEV